MKKKVNKDRVRPAGALNIREASEYLKVHRTVFMRFLRHIEHLEFRVGGRTVYQFDPSVLDKFRADHLHQPACGDPT